MSLSQESIHLLRFLHKKGKLDSEYISKYNLQDLSPVLVREMHALITITQYDISEEFGACFIRAFVSCGTLLEANLIFLQMHDQGVYAWHSIISAYGESHETDTAVGLYWIMQKEGLLPTHSTTLYLLGSCTERKGLSSGRLMNDYIIRNGQILYVSIASSLIDMYAKCGSTEEAQKMFDNLSVKNVVTWNALISGYSISGEYTTALRLFEKMKQEAVHPVKVTYLCLLKACSSSTAGREGNLIHHDIVESGFEVDLMVGNAIIDFYAKCGLLQEAGKVFNGLRMNDAVSWNSMISGHVQSGNHHAALSFFNGMQQACVVPDAVTFSCALQACTSMKAVVHGQSIHKQLIEAGVNIDSIVGTTLIDMYAKCGCLEDARQVFDGLKYRNSILWGTMIAGYTMHGNYDLGLDLVKQMCCQGIKLEITLMPLILQICAGIDALVQGRIFHDYVLISGWEEETAISNVLIDMYIRCGSLAEALNLFNQLIHKDVVSWNTMITGCVLHDDGLNALILFERMQLKGFSSDKVTFIGALKACINTGSMIEGKKIHDQICRSGVEIDVILGGALVDMYAKWGNLLDANAIFQSLACQDKISCSSMIVGYIECENWLYVVHMYELMRQKDIKSDNISFACVLKACTGLEAVNFGKCVHDDIIRNALDKDTLIGNALIDMYAKCGRLHEAHYSFDTLVSKNLTSWNAMMTGYTQYDDSFPALLLFQRLKEEGMSPDKVTLLCVLKACINAGSTDNGRLIHDEVVRNGFECDSVICNSIIDVYCKCGKLQEAHKIFDGLSKRDVVSWSTLMSGYAQHGNFEMVEFYLNAMKNVGLKPTSKTFTSILGACSHSGRVKECQTYFRLMKEDFGIVPSIEHCNCMIDILGRAGHVDDAFKFLQSLPILPNVKTWMTLLTSCRAFGKILLGKYCFDQLMKLDPNNASAFLIMLKIYADGNMWDDVYELEEISREKGAWKIVDKAWIDIDAEVHEFLVAGMNCQRLKVGSVKPTILIRSMRENGYVPQSNTVLDAEVIESCVSDVYHQRVS